MVHWTRVCTRGRLSDLSSNLVTMKPPPPPGTSCQDLSLTETVVGELRLGLDCSLQSDHLGRSLSLGQFLNKIKKICFLKI